MSIFTLNITFRRLSVLGKSINIKHYHTYKQSEHLKALSFLQSTNLHQDQLKSVKDSLVILSPLPNLDLNVPKNGSLINRIIESPLKIKHEIENPLKIVVEKIDKTPEVSLDLPTNGTLTPKIAAYDPKRISRQSMLKIRRRKIKKHKRQKLRNKREVLMMKINIRRGVKREQLFQAELWGKVKEAQKFNAKEYVTSRIHELTKERIPPVYQGHIIPEAMVRKFMEEDRKKKEKKRNKPRLTL